MTVCLSFGGLFSQSPLYCNRRCRANRRSRLSWAQFGRPLADKQAQSNRQYLALEMSPAAKDRKLEPEAALFDSWYAAPKAVEGGAQNRLSLDNKNNKNQMQSASKRNKRAARKRWIIEERVKLFKSEYGFETRQARAIPTIRARAYICLTSFNTLESFRARRKLSTLYRIRSALFNQPIRRQMAWNLDSKLFA